MTPLGDDMDDLGLTLSHGETDLVEEIEELLEDMLAGECDGGCVRVLNFTRTGPFICNGTFCVTEFKKSFIDLRSIIDNNIYAATLDSSRVSLILFDNLTVELYANNFKLLDSILDSLVPFR